MTRITALAIVAFVPLLSANAFAQNINTPENFPDSRLRVLVEYFMGVGPGGEFTAAQAAAKTGSFDCSNRNISDMTGLEYLTGITELDCDNNQLTTLDVSANTALTRLWCNNNQLTSLEVSSNTALMRLSCNNNQLRSLDVSADTALTWLECDDNQLTSLDVINNTALNQLSCHHNQLTSLDVSKNTALTGLGCAYNQLTSLDVSTNAALTHLSCGSNQLTNLDVSTNTALTRLHCLWNQLTSLDVSNNAALTFLDCRGTELTTLDVSNNTALTHLNCDQNQLTSLDVTANTALAQLQCADNQLTTLDVSNNAALTSLTCSENQLTSLHVSSTPALTQLECNSNQLTSLDVSNNPALIDLRFSVNQIASIDISNQPDLSTLHCYSNHLTSLDLSHNSILTSFSSCANQLTNLDLRANSLLEYVDCAGNLLTSLDLSNNTALTRLECAYNQLTSLDLSANTNLNHLECHHNELTNLNVSVTPDLRTLWSQNNNLTEISSIAANTNLTAVDIRWNSLDSGDWADVVLIRDRIGEAVFHEGDNVQSGIAYSPQRAGMPVQGDVLENPANGHTYVFYRNNNSWEDAEQKAVSWGGHLVTINDAAENQWIVDNLLANVFHTDPAIGYTDKDVEGNWVWASGETPGYTNWDPGEPNGSNDENYAVMYSQGRQRPGNWNDLAGAGGSAIAEIITLLADPVIFGKRFVSTRHYAPGDTLTVSAILTNIGTQDSNIYLNLNTIEEYFPDGWTVNNISHNGSVNGNTVSWNVTIPGDSTVSLSYDVAAPLDASGDYSFSGNVIEGAHSISDAPNINTEPNFPDPNFRAAVEQSLGVGPGGYFNAEHAAAQNWLDCSNRNVSDITGIQFFTGLTGFNCNNNQLTSMDLSNNLALTDIGCGGNHLASLDVSANTALTSLGCGSNQLTSLDVSNQPDLTELSCNNNQLTALDVSNNANLSWLHCYENQLTQLNVSGAAALTNLQCNWNQLRNLDLSTNTALRHLNCGSNQLTSLGLSVNTLLTHLWCDRNQLTTLDVSNLLVLEHLTSECNQLNTLDVSRNPNLTFLSCYENQLTALDVANDTALTQLDCQNNQLTTLDVSGNSALIYLNFGGNSVTNLDVSNNPNLRDLSFWSNQLTTLDVSNNPALDGLDCNNNRLASLDVSANTALTRLYCGGNQLTNLDISNQPDLTELWCNSNQLTNLDVSTNTVLSLLDCRWNQLASISSLVANMALSTVDVRWNNLDCGDCDDVNALLARLGEAVYGEWDNLELGLAYSPQNGFDPYNCGPVEISVSPGSMNFGWVEVGSSVDWNFVVKNTGCGTLSGTASVGSGPFSIVSGESYTLELAESHRVTLRYSPTTIGDHSAEVTFTGGSGATAPLSGSGYDPSSLPTYGIFDQVADWGSPESPPQRGEWKVPGRVIVNGTAPSALYDLVGNGDDIWNDSDEGLFVYTEKSGSWTLTGKVSWIDRGGESDWAKIGVMIRDQGAVASSKHYWMMLRSGPGPSLGDGIAAQWRATDWEPSGWLDYCRDSTGQQVVDPADGLYLRVTRIAPRDLFLSEWSYDGVEWNLAHTYSIEMGETVAYGLAITNHLDNELLANATVTDVLLEPAPPVAFRSFPTDILIPGESVDVTLEVLNPTDSAVDVTVTETLATSWTASGVSHGGSEVGGVVTWILSAAPGKTFLTYTATSPIDYEGAGEFAGSINSLPTMGADRVWVRAISVTPAGLDFGQVAVGSWAEQDFRVENLGPQVLSGSASVPTGPFSIVSGESYSLGTGQSQTVTVRYNPTSAGVHNAMVTFTGGGGTARPVSGFTQEGWITLFQDDFEDGNADGWDLPPSWGVERDGDNYILSGGQNWAHLSGGTGSAWTDYYFSLWMKPIQGGFNINVRMNNNGRYIIELHDGGVSLSKELYWNYFNLTQANFPIAREEWHTVSIALEGNRIRVAVDGVERIDYTDTDEPLLYGSISLEIWSPVHFDNVLVIGKPIDNINTPENFPDPNFQAAVEEFMGVPPGGEFSADQAAARTDHFHCSGWNIADITGLEYFTGLTGFNCSNNQLASLDVSNNPDLNYLDCQNNGITSLDVSNNRALTDFYCGGNQLTNLDVSYNTALTTLYCDHNQLTALDVSNNTTLTELCSWNNQLTSLDVSKNTALESLNCGANHLTSLDVHTNSGLVYLECSQNQLPNLDVSNQSALTQLYCGHNQLTNLNISLNTSLAQLSCHDNQLTSLNVTNNPALTYLDCWNNQLTSLDVSANIVLEDLQCQDNQLTSLNVSNNTALTHLQCSGNQLTSLDVSANTALTDLMLEWNQVTSIDVSNLVNLVQLKTSDNAIGSLNVSNNTALETLYCYANGLTSLDVSNNPNMNDLWCQGNQLTSLDLSNNSNLTRLWCSHNQLTGLDVSSNAALTQLYCDNNQLTDISSLVGNTALGAIDARWNNLDCDDWADVVLLRDRLAEAVFNEWDDLESGIAYSPQNGFDPYNCGPPEISVRPEDMNFGWVEVGSSIQWYFAVQNVGGGILSGNASVPAGPISIASGESYELETGERHSVAVRYSPASLGDHSAEVTFTGGGDATRPVSGTAYDPSSPPSLGIFDQVADWGSPDSPPQRGEWKVPGRVIVSGTGPSAVYDLVGNGDNIWDDSDEGLFVYTEESGSWVLTGRVSLIDQGGDSEWAQIGIMIREKGSLTTSKNYCSVLHAGTGASLGGNAVTKWRDTDGGSTASSALFTDETGQQIADPGDGLYLRVTRIAPKDLFFSEWSYDGIQWNFANTYSIEMGESVAYGLAITNVQDNELLARATATDVSLTPFERPVAIRRFPTAFFLASSLIDVTVEIFNPDTVAYDVTVTEILPPEWTASEISPGGSFADGIITWNVTAASGSTYLTYQVEASASPPMGTADWFGHADDVPTLGANSLTFVLPPVGIFDGHVDIGYPGAVGDATFDPSTGQYDVSGSGHDIWDQTDDFHFVFKELTGPFSIKANGFADAGNSSSDWVKAALTVRDNLTPGSANALARIRVGVQNFSAQWRDVQNSGSGSTTGLLEPIQGSGTDNAEYEGTIEIERWGHTILHYYYDLQGTRRLFHSHEVAELEDPVYAGLAVTSHQTGAISYGTFNDVVITQYPFSINRTIPVATYVPGSPVSGITLTAEIGEGQTVDFTVTETPPENWPISNISISDGNATVNEQGQIVWTLAGVSDTQTLTYDVTPLEGALFDYYISGSGVYLDSGNEIHVSIFGDSVLFGPNINTQEYFPDPNFRAAVEEFMGVPPGGEFSAAQATARTDHFDCSNRNIADTTGLEFFTGITGFNCSSNQLTGLDVTHNIALTYLDCGWNQLPILDVSNNTALTELSCVGNQLTSLDLSNNSALTHLHCEHNQVASLDLSHNTALAGLDCEGNELRTLDVSNNAALTGLNCGNNQLMTLDLSDNLALTGLNCDRNQLTILNVSANTALTYLNCDANQLTSLDVSNNTALLSLDCPDNHLTILDVSNNTVLKRLDCNMNQLTSLDLSKNNALEWLDCRMNQLTTLNVSNQPDLTFLDCHNNQLTSLDVSANPALTGLRCKNNQLTSVNVSNNPDLTYLDCRHNQLADVSDLIGNAGLSPGITVDLRYNNFDCDDWDDIVLFGDLLRDGYRNGLLCSPQNGFDPYDCLGELVYSNDFEGAVGTEWSNQLTDTTPADGRTFFGQFGNATVGLTLNDLPTYRGVTVSFDLFVIQSWDGNSLHSGPDVWNLSVFDGPVLLHTTFSLFDSQRQAYPGNYPEGDYPARTGATANNTLGYGEDSVYHLSFTFPHLESSITLDFSAFGLQELEDESWGLDNVEVRATAGAPPTPTPTPSVLYPVDHETASVTVLIPDHWFFPVEIDNGQYWEPFTDIFGDGTIAIAAGTYSEGQVPDTMNCGVAFIHTDGSIEEYWGFYADDGTPWTANFNEYRVIGNPPRIGCDRRPGGTRYIVGQQASPFMYNEFNTDGRWTGSFAYDNEVAAVQLFNKTATGPDPITRVLDPIYMTGNIAGAQNQAPMRFGGELRSLSNGNFVVVPEDRTGNLVAGRAAIATVFNGETGEVINGPFVGTGDGSARAIWSNVAAFNGGFVIRASGLLTVYDNDGNMRYMLDQGEFTTVADFARGDATRITGSNGSNYVYIFGKDHNEDMVLSRFDAVNSSQGNIVGINEVRVNEEAGSFGRAELAVDDFDNVCVAWEILFSENKQIVARIFNSNMDPVTPTFFAFIHHDAADSGEQMGFLSHESNVSMDNERIIIAANGITKDPDTGQLTPGEQTFAIVLENPLQDTATPTPTATLTPTPTDTPTPTPTATPPEGVPVLSLQPEDAYISPGGEKELTVHMTETEGVTAYRVALHLDTDKVTYVSGSASAEGTSTVAWQPITINDTDPTHIILNGTSRQEPLGAGEGTLCKLRFRFAETLQQGETVSVLFDRSAEGTRINDGAIPIAMSDWTGMGGFLWGDLNDDGVPGAVDAGLLLRYDVFLIDRFPRYPDIVFPDYPPAADLNGDGVAGAVDAGLLLRYDVFLILWFPADLDADGYGPDAPAAKMSSKKSPMSQQDDAGESAPSAGRRLAASVEPLRSQESSKPSWVVNFSVDDAADIQGLRLALHYDPDVLKVGEDSAKWLVSDPGKELLANVGNDGLLIVSGALSKPLGPGARDLMSVRLEGRSERDEQGNPVIVRLDRKLTRINDGNIYIDPESTSGIGLILDTSVSEWMIYR